MKNPVLAALVATVVCGLAAAAQAGGSPPYVGTYHAVRQGADSLQDVTLEVLPSGVARITTRFPGYRQTAAGAKVYPVVESGTWPARFAGPTSFSLVFTKTGELVKGRIVRTRTESVVYRFTLTDCVLVSSGTIAAPKDLLFRREDCTPG